MRIKDLYSVIVTEKRAECREFYIRWFGFQVVFEASWFVYLAATGDHGFGLAFMAPDHPSQPPGPETFTGKGMFLTLQVEDAAAEFERLKRAGLPIAYPLRDEPWGQRRFAVHDPSGTWVDVVEQIEPQPGFSGRVRGVNAAIPDRQPLAPPECLRLSSRQQPYNPLAKDGWAVPARDIHHDALRRALTKQGWEVTHDPFHMQWGERNFFVDLGVEHLLAAAQGGDRIAVEVKTFGGPSLIADLQQAVGQFIIYREVLRRVDPGRRLYLAVDITTYAEIFAEPIGDLLLETGWLQLVVFDPDAEVVVRWLP